MCRTVVKHEAFAVSKASGRSLVTEEPLAHQPDEGAWTDERAERYERLRVGAEAMAGLKPQEIRCLLLKAEGLSYQEICAATGFTYTKVNRCLTEGRRAFLSRVAGIEAGAECQRLGPLISKLSDGEASADELRALRPHLKGCLACKATLREYRAAPGRIAGLVPPVVALAGGGGDGDTAGLLARLLERLAGMGDALGGKAAAVAASAVVIAGGSAAGIDAIHHDPPAVATSAFAADAPPPRAPAARATATAPAAAGASAPDPSTAAMAAVSALAQGSEQPAPEHHAPAPMPAPTRTPAPKAADPLPEFDPGTIAAAPPPPQPREFSARSAPTPAPPANEFGGTATPAPAAAAESQAVAPSRPAKTGSSGSAAGEFGP